MSAEAQQETLEFQTEVQQLLDLMIHSLYSNPEIFLRELVSNASDAADKLRFEALKDESLLEDDPELAIRVHADSEARTVTIEDNGIGMSRDDVVENLGTIARSGTQRFLEAMTGDEKQDAQLIGQFGVGFYSAFIVADRVDVYTRRAGESPELGVHWSSDGKGAYSVEYVERPERGTRVVLHLAEERDEFLEPQRLRHIIRRYSDHISLPIRMPAEADPESDEAPGEETVNQASALWMRPKGEISDEEYIEFYKHVAHDFEAPLTWLHNKVEGNQAYTSLLYIPARRPFDLFDQDQRHGVKLYVRRVFIMEDSEHLMPRYLRFVRGVIDSDDLPLNVSRELLQHNKLIDRIRGASVKRVLDTLERMSRDEPENYATFWSQFGSVLKEGVIEDSGNRERIAGLLRFSSTQEAKQEADVTLADYVARMREGQKHIYYVTAEGFNAARNSPHLEIFRKKGVEVLLLHEPIDEWLASHLHEFQGYPLQSVAKGELDLDELEDETEKQAREERAEALRPLTEKLQESLGERVSEVRVSDRLTDSPACLVVGDYELGMNLQRMLKAAGHEMPQGAPALEINPDHALIQRLEGGGEDARFDDWAQLLFDQAQLTGGGQLEDPAAFVQRVNRLLETPA
ncbi:molecular chaperone HtpG [Arhodomonas aquaeolei]|uniref:molecular chaperone HtpG n=1 Tax=Arhodomonas aquaeolei TaxID=2369 RepID=UPI0003829483|nr:molecular chaperone HtpG [Arhodomonas aquaeolei]